MNKLLKAGLKGIGLYGPALKIRTSLDPMVRRFNRDYKEFRRHLEPIFGGRPIPSKPTPRLLLVGIHEFVPSVKIECLLARAVETKGYFPVVLLNRPCESVERYYRLFGITEFIYLDDYLAKLDASLLLGLDRRLEEFFGGNPSFDDILRFEYRGYEVGKHGLSWVVRSFHSGTPDFADPKILAHLRETFKTALRTAHASEEMLEKAAPDMAIFNERGYTPYGEVFDACLKRGVNTIQFVGSHLNEALHFKRYTLETRSAHPISLDPRTWEEVKRLPISPGQEAAFINDHYSNYKLGNWYARQKVQTGKAITTKDETYRVLGLTPSKKTAVIFSQVLWDATFFYGEGVFKDYAEWLVETVRAACANPRLNWVVKLHPANVWRLEADGFKGELVEHILIRENIGTLPPHVVLLNPDTKVNTFSLFEITDYCLTVRGTIGMEMPIFGIPVITAGTGRYSELGFTVNSSTRQEYMDRLSRIEELPRLTEEQTRLARKHAYAVFKLRPLVFTAFRMEYPNDKSVPTYIKPFIRLGVSNLEGLNRATDMAAFAEWAVDRDRIDYLGPFSRMTKAEKPSAAGRVGAGLNP